MSADRLPSLENELRALAPRISYAATPELAAAVGQRLRDADGVGAATVPAGRRTRWWSDPRVAAVAAAIVTVLALVLLVSPDAREAVASIFRGVRGIRVVVEEGRPAAPTTPTAPTPTTASTPTTAPASPPSTLPPSSSRPAPRSAAPAIPGVRTTLAAARVDLSFTPLLPPSLGPPDRVHLERIVASGMLTMVWLATPTLPAADGDIGAVLTEFEPPFNDDFPYWTKSVRSDGSLRRVTINGAEGTWVAGGHRLDFKIPDSAGWVETASSRIAANTLIWVQNGVTMRLESALPLDAALRLAESIR